MNDRPAYLWTGRPTPERTRQIQKTFYFDHDNRRGKGYGVMFTRTNRGLVVFDEFGKPPSVR